MIPVFPNFKKLEVEDKSFIDNFVKSHPPYSDFNFISLHSWDVDSNTQFSLLNDNLVITMKDYTSDKRIITFLGTNEIEATLEALLSYANKIDSSGLQLIPESIINNYPKIFSNYTVTEERDHFDYIYKVEDHVNFEGKDFYNLRNNYSSFINKYNVETRKIDISSIEIQNQILGLLEEWKVLKIKESKNVDEDEFHAIQKFFKVSSLANLVSIGVFSSEKLIGFNSVEIVHNNYGVGHFEKTNHEYKGITTFIRRKLAEELQNQGVQFLNTEQDLGIEGLRKAKMLWQPHSFLKKYTIK